MHTYHFCVGIEFFDQIAFYLFKKTFWYNDL